MPLGSARGCHVRVTWPTSHSVRDGSSDFVAGEIVYTDTPSNGVVQTEVEVPFSRPGIEARDCEPDTGRMTRRTSVVANALGDDIDTTAVVADLLWILGRRNDQIRGAGPSRCPAGATLRPRNLPGH